MVTYEEAHKIVLDQKRDYGAESISLKVATGRILAEEVKADRDFPPADRSTRDGIALSYHAVANGRRDFEVVGILAAGKPPKPLEDKNACLEIMTGAIIPLGADTVVPYEHIVIEQGIARLKEDPDEKQFIHFKGSDCIKGTSLLQEGRRLNPADIGILAAVGLKKVMVKKLPSVAVISTGSELVDIDQTPEKYQIRKSNTYSLHSALKSFGIQPMMLHISDDPDMIRQKLDVVIGELDVIMISGGVSKGKFDFIPKILQELQVDTLFHRVKQKPGKPFLFGVHKTRKSVIFSFPGNPVSTFYNFHLYFVPWFKTNMGIPINETYVTLAEARDLKGDFLQLIGAELLPGNQVKGLQGQHSGNLIGLSAIDGFFKLNPNKGPFGKGSQVPFINTRTY